jgi:hypothetical protein
MNNDVAERLISNLEKSMIEHDQDVWLSDHSEIFVISEGTRWTCATTGCAAGFTWLQEAPEGSVFDIMTGCVFDSLESLNTMKSTGDYENFRHWTYPSVPDEHISKWSAKTLGLANEKQLDFLFYNSSGTEGVIDRIRFLMEHPDTEQPEVDHYNHLFS